MRFHPLTNALACLVAGACVHGQAKLTDPPLSCDATLMLCAEACVDVGLDNRNCGACGVVCSGGEVCSLGNCGTECVGGTSLCGDRCVDLQIDPSNCGDCGVTCGGNEACAKGSCSIQCGDGVQNGVETDVDCGGPLCAPCALGAGCIAASDCGTFSCSASVCDYPTSCAAIEDGVGSIPDGSYTIDPDGAGDDEPIVTFCLTSVLGGGWTLVQRTVWDWNLSGALLTNYDVFRNTTLGSSDPDQAFRIAAKHWPSINEVKDSLIVHEARKAVDGTSCGPLYYTASAGAWDVPELGPASISGVVQTVTMHNGSVVTTTDTGPSPTCVNNNSGVPWTYGACCATCPTYGGSYFDPPRPMVSYLATADALGNTVSTQCGADAPVMATSHYGLNAMSYYLR